MMAVPIRRPATTVALWRGRRNALRTAMRHRMGRRRASMATARVAAAVATRRTRTSQSIGAALSSARPEVDAATLAGVHAAHEARFHVDDAVATVRDGLVVRDDDVGLPEAGV